VSGGLDIVVIGLSLSSSWGNGHAVTYRALLQAMARLGHRILFLERDVPWYAAHRDLDTPGWCELAFYLDLQGLEAWRGRIAAADAVVIGSYTPDGMAVAAWAFKAARGPVVFYDIDTPVTLAALDRGDCAYLAPRQIARYDAYLSFTGGPTLQRLETQYGSPRAVALCCSADPEIYKPTAADRRWDLSYLGTYSDDRQPALERLLIEPARREPGRRFAVAGPQYPADIAWPANVERLEHVPPAQHAAFYAASRFTLNITRQDMIRAGHSPSIRLFEAASCGAPVISDVWAGIEDVFAPGREILLAHDPQDVVEALAMDEAARGAIGEAARARLLSAHTPGHRAQTLERVLRATIDTRAGSDGSVSAGTEAVSA
jgi:spore maturation protein CgeB